MPFVVYLASAYAFGGGPKPSDLPGIPPLFLGNEAPVNQFHSPLDFHAPVAVLDPGYDAAEARPRKSCFVYYDPKSCDDIDASVRKADCDTIILDIEEPWLNPLPSRQAISARELAMVIDGLHAASLKVALYGTPVTAEGIAASKPLLDKCDLLCPSFYPFTRSWNLWAEAQAARVKLLKTAYPNKPIVPFITFTGVGQSGDGQPPIPITEYVGDTAVYLQLLAMRDAGTAGVQVWAGFDGTQSQPFGKWAGDPGWAVVKQFQS